MIRTRQNHKVVCVFWIAVLAATVAQGAESVVLILKNGDRISGTLTSEHTNYVTISNLWTRAAMVPVAAISRREKVAAPPANGEPLRLVAPGAAAVAAAGKSMPGLGTNAAAKPAKQVAGEVFAGADVGFGTRNRELYTGRLKAAYTEGRFRSVLDYFFTYGRTDGTLSANRMDASSKTDYDLTKRLYVYNLAAGGYDQIRKIDARYEAGPGAGDKLILRTNFVVRAEYGVNYQAQYFADNTSRESVYHRLAEDVAWKLNTRLSLTERFEYFPRLTEIEQYRLRIEANLKYMLGNSLSLNLTVIDLYDSQPAAGVRPSDVQLLSSIGLKF